jgi:tryptophan synthase alpha subunit
MSSVNARAAAGPLAIAAAFGTASGEGRAALITFLTVGFPSLAETPTLVRALAAGGADLIELGVPFSDPLADGPTIASASATALAAGVTPGDCLDVLTGLRSAGVGVPLLLMGYYNPILSYGLQRWCRDAARAGADGLIVADLPLEEAAPLRTQCRASGLALVPLAGPTTTPSRLARIAGAGSGFLYLISRLGTTGTGSAPDLSVIDRLKQARDCAAGLPVAVGFGIATPAQIAPLRCLADGIIVGSAIVDRATSGPVALEEYTRTLAAACRAE